jgi:electron transfer flavoprotein-quinone oxidoreductase
LESTFVLRDHRKLRKAHALVLSDRVQHLYPEVIGNTVERMYRVDNPDPKPGLLRIMWDERKRSGARFRDLARDAIIGMRSFG